MKTSLTGSASNAHGLQPLPYTKPWRLRSFYGCKGGGPNPQYRAGVVPAHLFVKRSPTARLCPSGLLVFGGPTVAHVAKKNMKGPAHFAGAGPAAKIRNIRKHALQSFAPEKIGLLSVLRARLAYVLIDSTQRPAPELILKRSRNYCNQGGTVHEYHGAILASLRECRPLAFAVLVVISMAGHRASCGADEPLSAMSPRVWWADRGKRCQEKHEGPHGFCRCWASGQNPQYPGRAAKFRAREDWAAPLLRARSASVRIHSM